MCVSTELPSAAPIRLEVGHDQAKPHVNFVIRFHTRDLSALTL